MNIGIRAHDLPMQSLENLVNDLSYRNLNTVQLALNKSFNIKTEPGFLTPGLANHISNAFRQANIQIAVLGCYVNIIHPDINQRRQALERFKEHLRYVRDFGCSIVGTETGSINVDIIYTEENFAEAPFLAMVESVKELVAEAEKFGVIVGIEPGVNHPLHSPEKVSRLLTEVNSNNLQIIFDPVNFLTSDNYLDQNNILQEAIDSWGDRVAVLHAKDFIVEKGSLRFVPLGQGWMDYDHIFEKLVSRKPHMNIIMDEIDQDDIERSSGFIKKLNNKFL
ncbi:MULTISPECIES: sugar phosphate isomerase/epimerase [unclassified Halomonas]|uniref:sugar phosphate isomerase/epimerase family protein n=1 Tax=unclassified Halomonas TaxID=2609666 RepID=UPI0007D906BC|nr:MULTISPECIES: sugar phosphate isomerase/epimerase [unclassified Halomonas]MBT2785203.1 sugar phosphate isomerase/epimerase [Halomonas sp. ISL-106]MBT2799224.1 sugar phosphate isomerase/epimerase [Halomonas sp. ISL-104]OAL59489.1 AP endonuclease [Halomonas sp. ALS9]